MPTDPREFWEEARARVARGECDFRGWTFPEDPDQCGFRNMRFEADASFKEATFEGKADISFAKFAGGAEFDGAVFKGDTWFSATRFKQAPDFTNARFEGDAYFGGAVFRQFVLFCRASFAAEADFVRAQFQSTASFLAAQFAGTAKFGRASFRDDACFVSAIFAGEANFVGATFVGLAGFKEAQFAQRARFARVQFIDGAQFTKTTFSGDASFAGAAFRQSTVFQGAVFRRHVVMRNAIANGSFEVDLPRVEEPGGMRRPFEILGAGHDVYRVAKQGATLCGDYKQAGDYHYHEHAVRWAGDLVSGWKRLCRPEIPRETAGCSAKLRAQLSERSAGLRTLGWALLAGVLFGKYLIGYGERPLRILGGAAVVIVLSACLFMLGGLTDGTAPGGVPGHTHGPLDCAYFSFVTFTTLGYGDLHPVGLCRIVAVVEAVLGALLMALFVVALARKYTR